MLGVDLMIVETQHLNKCRMMLVVTSSMQLALYVMGQCEGSLSSGNCVSFIESIVQKAHFQCGGFQFLVR